ncbi:hypothetical protein D3C72_1344570 [compost metagenome]
MRKSSRSVQMAEKLPVSSQAFQVPTAMRTTDEADDAFCHPSISLAAFSIAISRSNSARPSAVRAYPVWLRRNRALPIRSSSSIMRRPMVAGLKPVITAAPVRPPLRDTSRKSW